MSIHKSQGMTIDIAEVDAGQDIFECGQTYVALSRVKSLEGLYLTSFDVTKIKMNNWAMGTDAQGSLIQASNGKIYGMTNLGGVSIN